MVEIHFLDVEIDFLGLVAKRREEGLKSHTLMINGETKDEAIFRDTSRLALIELADTYIFLSFEYFKCLDRKLKLQARRLDALRTTIVRIADDVNFHRVVVEDSYPELLEDQVPEGVDV